MRVDLHIHSNYSDGDLSPQQLVDNAILAGLDVIAITDHDTLSGVPLAVERAKGTALKVVSGVELSTMADREIHILAFNLDYNNSSLVEQIGNANAKRIERNGKMVKLLNDLDIDISMQQLYGNANGSVGRRQIAKWLVNHKYVETELEAFDKYIGAGKVAYVAADRMSPIEAIKMIKSFNGVSVLAHPKNLKMGIEQVDAFVKTLAASGLDGIEADYFTHTTNEHNMYRHLANKYKLIVTGGSDFHTVTHGALLGGGNCNLSKKAMAMLGVK